MDPDPLAQAQEGDDVDGARLPVLHGGLQRLRDTMWAPAVAKAPRIGLGADPNADLADVLRREALSTRVTSMGMLYL